MKKLGNQFTIEKLKILTTEINLMKDQADSVLEAVECAPEKVVVHAGERTCRPGQLVEFKGKLIFSGKCLDFSGFGKIRNTDPIGNQQIRVTIEMHDFNKDLWTEFINCLAEAQNTVDKTFRQIKGTG